MLFVWLSVPEWSVKSYLLLFSFVLFAFQVCLTSIRILVYKTPSSCRAVTSKGAIWWPLFVAFQIPWANNYAEPSALTVCLPCHDDLIKQHDQAFACHYFCIHQELFTNHLQLVQLTEYIVGSFQSCPTLGNLQKFCLFSNISFKWNSEMAFWSLTVCTSMYETCAFALSAIS